MTTWIDNQDQDMIAVMIERHGDRLMEQFDTEDVRFAIWLGLVDRRIIRRVGFGLMDIEDWAYRDAYDDGMSPSEAAREALEYSGAGEMGGW